MKKDVIKKAALGMSAAALAVIMSFSACAETSTADDSGRIGPPPISTENGNPQGQSPKGMPPAFGHMGEKPEDGKGPMEEIKEKVEALTDSSAKTKIGSLIEEYEAAMEAERKLMDANRPEKPEDEAAASEESERKDRPEMKEGLRPEPPENANGTLSEIKEGEKPEMPEESEEMKAAREAVETARKALEDALKEAGIETFFGGPQMDGQGQMEKPGFQPDRKPEDAPEIPTEETESATA